MIVGDICVEGDLKVTGVLKNGADKAYTFESTFLSRLILVSIGVCL